MLRSAKMWLIVSVALWGFVGVLQNIIDWDGTFAAVRATTSMTTFEGGNTYWQATANPLVVWSGALFIMLSKLTTGVLCAIGALNMWRARRRDATAFTASKKVALTGCAVAVIMLFGGFVVIAESWFELWRSDVMRDPVLGSVFRYGGMITLIAIFVASNDE